MSAFDFDDDWSEDRVMAAQAIGRENARKALCLADKIGGWTTTDLVARVVYQSSRFQIKYGEVLLNRLVREKFFIPKKLEARKQIYILSTSGAAEVCGTPSTNWGRKNGDGNWEPPACFDHDYATARFLVAMSWSSRRFETAHSIARINRNLRKIPDGLVELKTDTWFWVETERSRKSGSHMRKQADMILAVASGRGPEIHIGNEDTIVRPSGVIVLLPPLEHRDDRGHRIDHRARIVSSLLKAAKERPPGNPVKVHFSREQSKSPWEWMHEEDAVISFPSARLASNW